MRRDTSRSPVVVVEASTNRGDLRTIDVWGSPAMVVAGGRDMASRFLREVESEVDIALREACPEWADDRVPEIESFGKRVRRATRAEMDAFKAAETSGGLVEPTISCGGTEHRHKYLWLVGIECMQGFWTARACTSDSGSRAPVAP